MISDAPADQAHDEGPPTMETPSPVADDDHALLVDAATVFVQSLIRNPGLGDTIDEVVARYLRPPGDTRAGERLTFALNQLIDFPGGSFVLHYMGHNQPDVVLSVVKEVDATQAEKDLAEQVLRRLQALFGYEAADALHAMDQDPDDWASATRKVYYNVVTSKWSIELAIVKYNGESTRLVMTPDTATLFCSGILVGLNATGDAPIDPDAASSLFEQMGELLSRYGASISYPETPPLTGTNRLP